MTTQPSSEGSAGTEVYGNRDCEYRLIDSTKHGGGEEGGWGVCTNLNTDEGDLFPILGDNERPSIGFVIQHSPEPDDLQVFVANVLDGGNDPQFGH